MTPTWSSCHISQDNCFTFLRYLFAFCIFCNHFCFTTGQERFLCNGIVFVNGFFIISGFLTFNSYVRNPDVRTFAVKRLWRILPAYMIAVVFCFLVGLSLTTLPVGRFLTHPETWRYLFFNLLFLNHFQPTLPGVFEDNAMPFLNSSLWTMKVEIAFYVSVPVVYFLMRRFGKNTTLVAIVTISMIYYIATDMLYKHTGNAVYDTLNHQIPGELAFFYFPVIMLMNRNWFSRNVKWLFPVSCALFLLSYTVYEMYYLSPLTLSVLVIVFAYKAEPYIKSFRWKDITYEFYLLRFPVLQIGACIGFSGSSVWFVGALSFIVLMAAGLHHLCRQLSRCVRQCKV
ncbi:MAG: acyltransferase [Roseburia sp.]|nr:acyltransferase [Roseburia sp.]